MDDKQAAEVRGQTGRVEDGDGHVAGAAARPAARSLPSRPWFGGVILSCLALAVVWVLTYTLTPLPGQDSLGGWNYVVVGALLSAFIGLSKAWHGEPPRRTPSSGR